MIPDPSAFATTPEEITLKKNPQGLLRPYDSQLGLIAKMVDFLLVFSSLWLSCLAYDKSWNSYFLLAITAAFLFIIVAETAMMYRSWRSGSLFEELTGICTAWIIVVFVLLLLGYLLKTSDDYSRLVLTTWCVAVPVLLGLWRTTFRSMLRLLRSYGHNVRSVAIAGATRSGIDVLQTINDSTWMGLRFKGFFDDRTLESGRIVWQGPVQGNYETLLEQAKIRNVEIIYIALPLKAADRINYLLDKLSDTTASVFIVPDITLFNMAHGQWSTIGSLPVISIFSTPFYGLNGWLKRIEDIILASVILVIIALPMLFIAIGVRLSSPGSVLFRQRRYGLDGREIIVWKFRTMQLCENDDMITQATRSDPRITPFGKLLRRTSLDELPQFINVLRGDMSIVGPRPHAVVHNEQYRKMIKGYMLRHKVKPGITGWAQINGWRGETESVFKMEQRIKHDVWYIYNWSFLLDIKIIFLSFLKGFYGKNAF